MAEQVDLTWALKDGIELEDAHLGRVALRHEPLGEVAFPTGQIVACDPLVFPEDPPFVIGVKPGRYPLVLSIARFVNRSERTDERVACALLTFATEAQPVRWKMAVRPGQDANALAPGFIFGYGVDSGTGTLMDAAAAAILRRRFEEDRDYSDVIVNQMYPDRAQTFSGMLLTLDEEAGLNAPLFATGWGDGLYASYFGYDANGALTCLVTDFAVVGVVVTQITSEP